MSLDLNRKSNQKEGGTAGIFVFLLLLLLVAALALFVYMKSQNKDFQSMSLGQLFEGSLLAGREKNKEKDITEIKFDAREKPVFNVYNGLLVKSTRDSIKGIGKNGEEQWSIPVSIGNPFLKTGGKYILLADIGGRDVYVIEGREIRWTHRLENPIVNADIGENGYVTVIQEVKGYKGAVTVYNLQGVEFFTRTLAANYILNAKVSPLGNMVFMDEVITTGLKPGTIFEILDIQGKPLVTIAPMPEGIYPSFGYLGNDMMFLVSDKAIVSYDKEGKEKWKQSFPEDKILTSCVVSGKFFAFGVLPRNSGSLLDKGKSEVKIVNVNGKVSAGCFVEGELKRMNAGNAMIAAAVSQKAYFINMKGKLVGTLETKTDITDLFFLNEKEAAVVTKGSVVITPFQ